MHKIKPCEAALYDYVVLMVVVVTYQRSDGRNELYALSKPSIFGVRVRVLTYRSKAPGVCMLTSDCSPQSPTSYPDARTVSRRTSGRQKLEGGGRLAAAHVGEALGDGVIVAQVQ